MSSLISFLVAITVLGYAACMLIILMAAAA
jgi:hypothetical protein